MAENAAAEANVASEADVAGKAHGADEGKPLVGIVMGSDSDWNVMIEAAKSSTSLGFHMRQASFPHTVCPRTWLLMGVRQPRAGCESSLPELEARLTYQA